MSLHILLDSAPLGDLTRPVRSDEVAGLVDWAFDCLAEGHTIYVPEVIDYELRRELLRAGKKSSLVRLDLLKIQFE